MMHQDIREPIWIYFEEIYNESNLSHETNDEVLQSIELEKKVSVHGYFFQIELAYNIY